MRNQLITHFLQTECAVCGEELEQFWHEEEEKWMLKKALRHDDKYYHPQCFADLSVAPPADAP